MPAPKIQGLASRVIFTINQSQSPQLIDTSVAVFDEDAQPDYSNLVFTVSGNPGSDILAIRSEGTGSGQLFVQSGIITHSGTPIATYSGGEGTTLTVTFSTSDPQIISHVLSNVYIDAPAFDYDSLRELTYTLTDSSGAQESQSVILQFGDGSSAPTEGHDFLLGTSGDDRFDGEGGNDRIRGLDGNDVLIGNIGADELDGGGGSDTFYVDNAGDVVIDPVAAGVDRVATSVSYTLPGAADIEVFEVVDSTSTEPLNLGGNNFGQTMVGNAGNNVINGGGGPDTLVGLAGDDTLIGSPGDDTMYGGRGNDVYFVDSTGDQVIEIAGEGVDRVATSVSYALPANAPIETFETASLASTTAINLTGSNVSQYVIGNNGNNVLNGAGGNDWMIGAGGDDTLIGSSSAGTLEGGLGNDVYFVIDASDYIFEASGAGHDRLALGTSYTLAAEAEIEHIETTNLSATTAIAITGNAFAQLIVGNNGANTLDGKGGADVLVGVGGADTFAFTSALGGSNVDRIDGFVSGQDKIALDDAVFAAIVPGALAAGAFHAGTQAAAADDRIIYDTTSGALYYDPDGTGAAAQTQFATLSGSPALAGSDFILV